MTVLYGAHLTLCEFVITESRFVNKVSKFVIML